MCVVERASRVNYRVQTQMIDKSNATVRRLLQLRFDYDSIAIRLPCDCSSTALRPFDDLRYDRAAALRPN